MRMKIKVYAPLRDVKRTISDRQFQTSLFSKPNDFFFFFCIFRENFTVITYLYNRVIH